MTTETGAGQWGASLAYAARLFGLEDAVYQVKISYEQKPYRRSIMQTFGAQVTPCLLYTSHPFRHALGTDFRFGHFITVAGMLCHCHATHQEGGHPYQNYRCV